MGCAPSQQQSGVVEYKGGKCHPVSSVAEVDTAGKLGEGAGGGSGSDETPRARRSTGETSMYQSQTTGVRSNPEEGDATANVEFLTEDDITNPLSQAPSLFSLQSASQELTADGNLSSSIDLAMQHPYVEVERSLKLGREMRAMERAAEQQKSSSSLSLSHSREVRRGSSAEPDYESASELHFGPNGLLSGGGGGGQPAEATTNPLEPDFHSQSPSAGAAATAAATTEEGRSGILLAPNTGVTTGSRGGRGDTSNKNSNNNKLPLHIESLSTLCPRTCHEANLWNRNMKGGTRHPMFGLKLQNPKDRQRLRTKELCRGKMTGRALLINHPGADNEPLPFPCFETSDPGQVFADIAQRTALSLYHSVEVQDWRSAAEEAKAGYTLAGIQLTNFYGLFRHCHIKLCDLILVEEDPKRFLQLFRGSGLETMYIPSSVYGHGIIIGSASSSGSALISSASSHEGGFTTLPPINPRPDNSAPFAPQSPRPDRQISSVSILNSSSIESGNTVAATTGGGSIVPMTVTKQVMATASDFSAVPGATLIRLAKVDLVEEIIYTIKTIETCLSTYQAKQASMIVSRSA